MLYIINSADNVILAKFDAWDIDCEDKAKEFIKENGLKPISDETTVIGNRIIKVTK